MSAAKWIDANCPKDARILTDLGGFVRIYGDSAHPATLGYFEINADAWPEIIAEMKSRGVRYITWHDGIFAEFADAFYASRWRLDRFMQFGGDEIPAEMELIAELPGAPPVQNSAIH